MEQERTASTQQAPRDDAVAGALAFQQAPSSLPPALVPLVRGLSVLLFVPWAGVLVGLIILGVALTIYSPYFLTTDNIFNTVAVYFSWICISGFGEALVMIGGGLDLSVGSTMGLAGIISAQVLANGQPLVPALLAGCAVGIAVGIANGLAVTKIGLNPFIATLGMLSIVRGLTYGIVQGNAVTAPSNSQGNAFTNLGTGTAWLIPYPVIVMLVIGVLFTVLLNFTPWGRYIYAIGGNEPAARLLGLKVNRFKLLMYNILTGKSCMYPKLVPQAMPVVTSANVDSWIAKWNQAATPAGAAVAFKEKPIGCM